MPSQLEGLGCKIKQLYIKHTKLKISLSPAAYIQHLLELYVNIVQLQPGLIATHYKLVAMGTRMQSILVSKIPQGQSLVLAHCILNYT